MMKVPSQLNSVGLALNLLVALLLLQETMSNPLEEDQRGPPSDQRPPPSDQGPLPINAFATANPTEKIEFENDDETAEFNPNFDDDFTFNEDGESCRLGLINEWINKNEMQAESSLDMMIAVNENNNGIPDSTTEQLLDLSSLRAVQETDLYRSIVDDCGFFLEEFNVAAGYVCVQEQTRFPNQLYSQLWTVGPINMDGTWLLAADLLLSGMLQDSRPLVPCADSCYARYPSNSNSDCQQPTMATGSNFLDITQITSISNYDDLIATLEVKQRDLCYGWLQADTAYQNLRLCASESHVARTMIAQKKSSSNSDSYSDMQLQTARKVANAIALQRQQQQACSAMALEESCPLFDANGSEGDFEFGPTQDSWGFDPWDFDADWDTDGAFFANSGMGGTLLSVVVVFLVQCFDGW